MPDSGSKIAFLGGGNMARALIAGLLRQDVSAGQIIVGEPLHAARTSLMQQFGVQTTADNAIAAAGAGVLVLAVKPQDCTAVLGALSNMPTMPAALLLSIVAGVRIADLRHWCPRMRVVRAMPNRPALLGAGVTGVYAEPHIDVQDRKQAERILSAAGRVLWVNRETDIDLVTALSGSGPAYFFLLAEQMAAAATALGLDRQTAATLAAETLYGAGQLAHTGAPLDEQRRAVTSKGGTTEAALQVFAAAGFDALVARALAAAAARSAELADQSAQ